MRPFRGIHETISIDRSGRSGAVPYGSQDEIVIKHIANDAGVPFMYDDMIRVVAPNPAHGGTALLLMARYGNVFLESQFANGADATVFKMEIPYLATVRVDGVESPKDFLGKMEIPGSKELENLGDEKDAYRAHLLIRNNRAADDYGPLIAVSKALSLEGLALKETVADLIDVDQWLRVFAVQTLAGVGDTYTVRAEDHNISFVVRPSDNRVLALPWDWDFSFDFGPGSRFVAGRSQISNTNKWLGLPGILRRYQGHILDIVNTTYNNKYLDRWIDHYGALVGQNYAPIKEYVSERVTGVKRRFLPQVPFEITSGGGKPFRVDSPLVTVEGTGWINVREIRLAERSVPLDVEWITDQVWRLTVPVPNDENPLTFEAYDFQDNLITSDSIRVTSTADGLPIPSLRISQLHYTPAASTRQELAAGYNSNEFEFMELMNVGDERIDLSSVKLIQVTTNNGPQGVSFDFSTSSITKLAPGGRVLVVENVDAFRLRYGDGLPVAGQWSGRLNNDGEIITLGYGDTTIQQFAYDDAWHPETDGSGFSLMIVAPNSADMDI